jgi:hypothetical protein
VSGTAPAVGPTAGGTQVTVTGTNLTGTTGVTFGNVQGTGLNVQGATSVQVTTPPRAEAGAVGIVVQHPNGNVNRTNAFTYEAPESETESDEDEE